MSQDVSTVLFERIRERCRQLRWYGPDDENINWVEERYDPVSDHGGRLCAQCRGSQRRFWLRLWDTWGDGGLRWTWQWHHRGAVPRPFLRRGSLDLGRRKGPPDRSGRLRRSVGGSDRRVPRQGGKDLLAPDPPLSLLAGALPSHLPLGLCHRILPGLHKGWHLPGRVTKEEGHLISLQATSLQEMLERWLHLPSSSPALLRGYKLSHGTKASSPYGR